MIHWVWLHLETERATLHIDKYSMATIQELESFKLSDAVKFHKELNPRLWEDEKLDPEVRDQLLLIAEDFVEYLGLDNLKVEDVTISGSNAAYSYTPHSDLDLHILVDFSKLPDDPVYQELFTAKKTLYNDAHDITVHGVPVELYVQDINEPVQSLGQYSIVHDKWIRIPKKRRANFDEVATKAKYEKLGDLIELALKSKDPKKVKDTIALVKRYRKSGLDKHGEFGPENLAYKAVRKQGLVQALYDLKAELHGEKLSIEEGISDLKVYRNPSPKQLFRLTQRSAHKHMRGMYHDGDTYWWDGNDAIHKQGSDYLGIPYDYQQRMEAAIDSVSDNYRVGGDDGVPQDIIQKYDIENELVYEASAISMYSAWKDLPYETLNAIVNYYYSQDEADADYNERILRQLGFSVQTNDSPDNYENVLASSIKTNKKYLVPVPAAQEYCDKIYDEQYSDDDSVTPENEAAAWEEGWNAHESGKPISANPYRTASSKWDPIEKHMWDQGWNAAREDPYLREASGYIPSEKEKNDPRFKTALTVDVKPNSIKKNAKAFNWKTSRAGIPPQARADGKITEALISYTPDKKFVNEKEEVQYVATTVKDWRIRARIFETIASRNINESTNNYQTIRDRVMKSLVAFSTNKLKIGNNYIPIQINILRDSLLFYDVKGNSPAREPAEFGTLVELSNDEAKIRINNKLYNYPIHVDSANLMMVTVFLDSAEKYDQLRMMVSLEFEQSLPPLKPAVGELAEDLMREFKTFLIESAPPKLGYHVTATKNLPIIQKDGIKADKRGNSYVWDSREMAEWFMDFQNDEGQDRIILKIDMSGLDARPDPEAEDMSEWSSRFKPGTNGGAWIISGPIPTDKIIG
jgi:hypothetical protein